MESLTFSLFFLIAVSMDAILTEQTLLRNRKTAHASTNCFTQFRKNTNDLKELSRVVVIPSPSTSILDLGHVFDSDKDDIAMEGSREEMPQRKY